jgi:hypothetical protein
MASFQGMGYKYQPTPEPVTKGCLPEELSMGFALLRTRIPRHRVPVPVYVTALFVKLLGPGHDVLWHRHRIGSQAGRDSLQKLQTHLEWRSNASA